MSTALLILFAGWVPPLSAPRVPPPAPQVLTTEDAVVSRDAKQLPRVVVVTMQNCAPCERVKARLRPLSRRAGIDYRIEDMATWNARVGAGLQVTIAPTVFVWQDPAKSGKRWEPKPTDPLLTLGDVERWLGLNPTRLLARAKDGRQARTESRSVNYSSRPFLSVNGSAPGALHSVTVNGMAAVVEPNTESEWREHVAWHGYGNAGSMTPQQLAQAHADAHADEQARAPMQTVQRQATYTRTQTRRGIFRRRR